MKEIENKIRAATERGDLGELRRLAGDSPLVVCSQATQFLLNFITPMPEGDPSAPPNCLDMLRFFVSQGVDMEGIYDNQTLLGSFACVGMAEEVGYLVSQGATVDPPAWLTTYHKTLRHTPLMLAAANGQIECMVLLLNAGAGVEVMDEDGETAICWAVREGELEAAKLLHAHGADTQVKLPRAPNLIHLILENQGEMSNEQFMQMNQWLIEELGMDPDAPDQDGYSALDLLYEEFPQDLVDAMLLFKANHQAKQLAPSGQNNPASPRGSRL